MKDERWSEDTVRMGRHGSPRAEINLTAAPRKLPPPSHRTVVEIVVGLVAVILLGLRGSGHGNTLPVPAKHPSSQVSTAQKWGGDSHRHREINMKATLTQSPDRSHEHERGSHRKPTASPPPRPPLPPPAAPPAPAEAFLETAANPELTPPTPPSPEPNPSPPPTSPGSEFGM